MYIYIYINIIWISIYILYIYLFIYNHGWVWRSRDTNPAGFVRSNVLGLKAISTAQPRRSAWAGQSNWWGPRDDREELSLVFGKATGHIFAYRVNMVCTSIFHLLWFKRMVFEQGARRRAYVTSDFSSEHFEKITVLGYQSRMKPTLAISLKTCADQKNEAIFSGGTHVKSNTHKLWQFD